MESKYKFIIVKHFNYTFNFKFLTIIEKILNRVDISKRGARLEDDIITAIDDELIYTDDQWEIAKYYCSPHNYDYDKTICTLIQDLEEIVSEIIKQQEKDE